MKPDHLEIKNFNFIGLNSETTGDLTYYGKTYYFGKHQGNIHQADENEISIQQEAELIGDLKAINANIFGRITGNLQVTGTLNIFSGSSVNGSIKAKNLNIHPGSSVSGEVNSVDSL